MGFSSVFLAQRDKSPWDFLSDESCNVVLCYEVSFGPNLRMGASHPGTQSWQWIGTFICTPWSSGKEEGLEIGLILNNHWFNQSWLCNQVSIKAKKDGIWRASRLVNPRTFRKVWNLLAFSPHFALSDLLRGCFWIE